MASTFKGWLSSWGSSWSRSIDPNAMQGSASMTFTATATAVQPTGAFHGLLTLMRRRGRR